MVSDNLIAHVRRVILAAEADGVRSRFPGQPDNGCYSALDLVADNIDADLQTLESAIYRAFPRRCGRLARETTNQR